MQSRLIRHLISDFDFRLSVTHLCWGLWGCAFCPLGAFQAVRALMIVGLVLGVLGAVISFFSLTCLTMTSMEDSTKAKMSLTAGVMFITAGTVRNIEHSQHIKRQVHLWDVADVNTSLTSCLHLSIPFSQVCVALQELLSTPTRLWPLSGRPRTPTMEEDTEEACRKGWAWEWEWGWVEEWEECPRRI